MRSQNLLTGLFLLFLLSCGRMADPPSGGEASVSFRLCGTQTKVTGVSYADESAVLRWTVFVFDTRSGWFRWGSSAEAAPVTLSLVAGKRYLCLALVNYPLTGPGALHPSAVTSPDDLAEKVASLEDNEPGRLLMYGETVLMPTAGADVKTIQVRRLVSRVDVQGVSVDFSACPDWSGKTFLLKHIYVTNACRNSTYGADILSVSSARSAWYNTMGWHGGGAVSAAMDALLGDRDINASVDAAHPYSVSHSFYFYPNPVEDDDRRTDAWSPRCTRLVIEASVDGETFYYPIDIPPVERNSVCIAGNIVVHGPGWPEPEGGTLAGSILEVDWDIADPVILD